MNSAIGGFGQSLEGLAVMSMVSGDLCCDFCGRTKEMVLVLIAGPAVHICEVCVDICAKIVPRHRTTTPEELLEDAKVVRRELERMARVRDQ